MAEVQHHDVTHRLGLSVFVAILFCGGSFGGGLYALAAAISALAEALK